jgi:hypothetical protein
MIRIITSNHAGGITITVDGRLVGDYVDAVEMSVHQAMDQGRPVHLFLRDVSVIDESGRMLLSRLASKGVELSASGVYSSYIVADVRREPATSMRRPRPAAIPGIGSSAGHTAERRPTANMKPNRCDRRGGIGDAEREQL